MSTEPEQHQKAIIELQEQEFRLKYIIREAPVAIAVLHGPELIVESANKMMLEAWGKTQDIIGKPIAAGLPELQTQGFFKILDDVFTSGEEFHANEARVFLEHQGALREAYANFVYQPIKNRDGDSTDIIIVAVDVTEQVLHRKQIELAEERLRLATEAAGFGSWTISEDTNVWIPSAQHRNLYGITTDKPLSFEDTISMIRPDYQLSVRQAVEAAIKSGKRIQIEYPIVDGVTQKERWVRSAGRMIYNQDGSGNYLTGISTDITDQKQEVRRKNDFIAMVSHELKTPLTSLNGYVQVLLSRAKKAEDVFSVNLLNRTNNQIKKMSSIINGFLNVARFETGKINIDKQRFDLKELVKEVEEEIISTISSHQVIFNPVETTILYADKDKIGQVINNLISNAIKYSPFGSKIQISCLTIGDRARITVQDEGLGIAEQDIAHLFDRYYRVQNSSTHSIAGFGIGLFLCAEIVHRHQGSIGVESTPGKGSIFSFSLPLSN